MAQSGKTKGDLFASMEDDLKQFWAALSGALGAAAGKIAQRAGIVGALEDAMPLVPDAATFHKRLAALPLATYQAGETVLAAGSRSGRLLILRNGAVAIIKDAIEIAKVAAVRFARSATHGGCACVGDLAVSCRRRRKLTFARFGRASLRCGGFGTPTRRRQSSPH
jgi:hypothetical protein